MSEVYLVPRTDWTFFLLPKSLEEQREEGTGTDSDRKTMILLVEKG